MASQTLKQKTINSAIWTVLGYGSSQVLRFGANLALARFLEPQYFGLMAVINILLLGILLFSDIGIAQSIVNNPRGEERDFLDTAWTIQVLRGFLLWGIALAMTIPAANFYQDSRLLWLLPIAGLTSIIEGFHTTRIHVAQRTLDQRTYNLYELSTQGLYLAVLVTWAYLSPSIWALVGGSVIGALISLVGSYICFPGPRHRFRWEAKAVQDLVSLGRWIFFATATMFAAEQADRLILAKLVDWRTIGVYSIAYNLSNLPREMVKTFSYRVIYPAVVQTLDMPRPELRLKIMKQRRMLLGGSAVILAGLVTVGDLVISLLYNEKYEQAIWMMPLLCAGIWFSVLFYTISQVLLAIGKPMYSAQCNFVRFVLVAIGLPLGYYLGELPGAVLAISLSDVPLYLTNLYGLQKEQLSCIRQDLEFTGYFVALLVLCLGVRYALGYGYPIENLFLN
ncbi:oligosaccharide flippase family protein [filamentous cyanobacterium LEGE 11480]|uniref:Oligosaccharide flippase family protein n=1 Tax=Romeriopsis navalis LEGE 11480 TaxID=2777977 RepID=A0A928VNP8_9CYAN|nr:oligosaccharide flippase family protein [Romeriopsis navalis]MBE9029752.1 oligosaccharide flippase family protein [Romeriopsis navalis LEGE 11480]